ncbi:hypothetical protein FJT64_009645 [Amphibalanus amphitrite]|uniref:Mab-21-like HhH/H2TH-like domain-containing protein n=1 Tax=Amphibalanus amphitrite TaxID=1232801 RepID=A0A6A4VFL5_AMPAM|nr:hypothetical protein FJT64_009645 [Amphibalanus amphitrite]
MVKSYYAKTAMLWLCEQTPKDDWTVVSQSVIKLLDFLEEAIDTGNLPCYFWSQLNLLRFTSQGDRELMKKALLDIRQNLSILLARELCVYQPGLQKMLTQTTTQLTERQVRVCLARWNILFGVIGNLEFYLAMDTSPEGERLLSVLVHSKQFTASTVSRLLRTFSHQYILHKYLFKAMTVAPEDVTLQIHFTPFGHGFAWDAAPLIELLNGCDMRCLLGDPDAVRAWLRRQQQLPEAERPAGLPADLRSLGDLCDLLFNIPLLSQALRGSVLDKWSGHAVNSERAMEWLTHYQFKTFEDIMKTCLNEASCWKDKAIDFQTKVGMDYQTALRTACRFGVEVRRFCDDPETAREDERRRRRLPDPWGLLLFWLGRPL